MIDFAEVSPLPLLEFPRFAFSKAPVKIDELSHLGAFASQDCE